MNRSVMGALVSRQRVLRVKEGEYSVDISFGPYAKKVYKSIKIESVK